MMAFAKWWWLPACGLAYLGSSGPNATFADNIRPILQTKCVSCHFEGGMGPFNLQTYAQVRKRGDLVRQVALTGQMPPTDARSDFGSLTPHRPLEPRELVAIQEWYRLGMPEGRKTLPLAGPKLRKPDVSKHVATFAVGKGQRIPAEGRTVRTVYQIPLPPGGMSYWHHFSFQPDSPKAVRQVLAAVQKPGNPVPFTSAGVLPDVPVAAWSDGFNRWSGAGGYIGIEKGDKLWIQVRSVPTGKPEPASGLATFGRQASSDRILTKTLGNRTFLIEADTQVVLQSEWVLDRDIDLVSAVPEARFTTEQVRMFATDPSGQTRLVLLVLTWDPVWPGAYNFSAPIRLKKGTKLTYEAVINNTRHGHTAEDAPPKNVRFGPKSTDELFWCHLNYIPR